MIAIIVDEPGRLALADEQPFCQMGSLIYVDMVKVCDSLHLTRLGIHAVAAHRSPIHLPWMLLLKGYCPAYLTAASANRLFHVAQHCSTSSARQRG